MLTIYVVTLLGVIAAQVSPGPNLVAVASVALAQGRQAALFVVTGVASGDARMVDIDLLGSWRAH